MTDSIQNQDDKVADALRHSWVYYLPKPFWPYAQLARWERPIGWQLLMLPCWWSCALAFSVFSRQTDTFSDAELFGAFAVSLILYFVGSFLMRGAGCTFNDIVDRDIDDKVERTRSRPLPSGRVSKKSAWLFLVLQSFLGLGVLLLLAHGVMFTILLGVTSLVLVAIYPFMKRITWWPQLFLGLAFSWGALMGWGALHHEISAVSLCLYIGSICWVIAYDTIYAHQDIEDDALVGVKSTARLFAENTRIILTLFFAAALILIGLAIYLANATWPAWAGLAAGTAHIVWQLRNADFDDPADCLAKFKSNWVFGLIIFIGFAVSIFV